MSTMDEDTGLENVTLTAALQVLEWMRSTHPEHTRWGEPWFSAADAGKKDFLCPTLWDLHRHLCRIARKSRGRYDGPFHGSRYKKWPPFVRDFYDRAWYERGLMAKPGHRYGVDTPESEAIYQAAMEEMDRQAEQDSMRKVNQ